MLETLHNAAAEFATLEPNVQTAAALIVSSVAIAGIAVGLTLATIWHWALR